MLGFGLVLALAFLGGKMSESACGGIGYGFILLKKLNDVDVFLPKDLKYLYFDYDGLIVCIKESCQTSYSWEGAKIFDSKKFKVPKKWDQRLLSFAKENGIKVDRIDWWFCSWFS